MASIRRDSESGRGAVADALDGANNVLLRTSSMALAPRDCLPALVPGDADPASVDLLAVSYTRSADAWLSGYLDAMDVSPARAAVVEVGGTTRSAAAHGGTGGPDSDSAGDQRFAVEAVDIDDLTGLGISVSDRVASWSDDAEGPTVVCFDSLTALLQTGELERVYRFLHVLTARIGAADATAYFYFDPDAHDDRTVAIVDSLFDATVDSDDGDGGQRTWTVRTGR